MFHDYYLRGADRDTTRAALLAAGLVAEYTDERGDLQRVPAAGVNLSTIGTMYQGGEWDAGGNVITAPTALPGWHVNMRLERPLTAGELAALGSMLVEPGPATPYRVWA